MSFSFELSIEISEQYPFNKASLEKIRQNTWVRNQWPLVYFIQNDKEMVAYVGESTNAYDRIKNHLNNSDRCRLNRISIIGSDKFNKSATLDIESNLIQYLTAEGSFKLQNGNFGLVNHNYYQQDLYKKLFKEIWKKLLDKKFVTKTLVEIENSEVFKYSPYKSLNEDQYKSVLEILEGLISKESSKIFISGNAGTGKTILATYLIKLLVTGIDSDQIEELNETELREISYIKKFRNKYPYAKIGLVIAMTPLRKTLQDVFKKIPGLKSSMVINPSETFNLKEKYDLLIVDEAHRLRQRKNLSWMGAFTKNNEKLGLNNNGNELDWILANSKNQIFFYDPAQSIKPSDISHTVFKTLLKGNEITQLTLKSQMRVKGGNNYIQFVDDLLNVKRKTLAKYEDEEYELLFFDSFAVLHSELVKRESQHGLCRMIAGYSWPWLSNPKLEPKPHPSITDINLDGLKFKWNSTDKDWVNSPSAFNEVGCIHTTQGYDLNYSAVIFGREINYNKNDKIIEINSKNYYDRNGKSGVADEDELKSYIINIYKTLMYRGIKGTFVYACNKELREYLKEHIKNFNKKIPFRILNSDHAKPYVNSIPLVDISAAAGSFSDLQNHSDFTWVEPPVNISVKKEYFICKVNGDSMNKIIPNGAYCLFKWYEGGSREGKIVLAESTDFKDSELGSRYTVKEYHSKKKFINNSWRHEGITLAPISTISDFLELQLTEDDLISFKVIGIFEKVLD